MIDKNLIPQIVVDSVEKMLKESTPYVKDNYIQRVEMIRDFCQEALNAVTNQRNGKTKQR